MKEQIDGFVARIDKLGYKWSVTLAHAQEVKDLLSGESSELAEVIDHTLEKAHKILEDLARLRILLTMARDVPFLGDNISKKFELIELTLELMEAS